MKLHLAETEFEGFPVCAEYKYLGLKLGNKLYMDSQLNYIREKSQDIFRRLSPLLYKADLDTRKNFWQIFVQPLCEFVLPLLVQETSKTSQNQALGTIRRSFKLFTGLTKGTPNEIVDKLSGYNITLRARMVKWISEEKWHARVQRRSPYFDMMPNDLKPTKQNNPCKRMPGEMIQYINLSRSICKECRVPNTVKHLLYKHEAQIPDWEELTTKIQDMLAKEHMRRRQGVELARTEVKINLARYRQTIENITTKNVQS